MAVHSAPWRHVPCGAVVDAWHQHCTVMSGWTSRAALYDHLVVFIAPRLPPSRRAVYARLKAHGVAGRYCCGVRQLALGIRKDAPRALSDVGAPHPQPQPLLRHRWVRPQIPIFWTPERLSRAKAMRQYRQWWERCDTEERWTLEAMVYALRGHGLSESEVCRHVQAVLNAMRPWRMSDAKLRAKILRLAKE